MTSLWDELRGHEAVIDAFRRAVARGRLTQGYLLVGPDGIGKQRFARGLAQALLCTRPGPRGLDPCGQCPACRMFLAGTHPDFHAVERDAGRRELTVAKFVGEREQRGKTGLCHDLSLRPLEGSRKIAVINDADAMNDEAANALLKTLEEPPEGAVLLLVAANREAVLPTIRSRCQIVRFDPLPDAILADLLIEQQLAATPAEAQVLAALAAGSLSTARQLTAPALQQLRGQLLRTLSEPTWSGIAAARACWEVIEQAASDVPEQRQLAGWAVRVIVEFYRSALLHLSLADATSAVIREAAQWAERSAVALESAVDQLTTAVARCDVAMQQLEQNVGVALCLEGLCADLSRMFAAPARR